MDLNLEPQFDYQEIVAPYIDEDNSFFTLNLADGEDPVIQLVDHSSVPALEEVQPEESEAVDEEIEIDEAPVFCTNTSAQLHSYASSQLGSNSSCSPHPGFSVKGKYNTSGTHMNV